MILSSPCIIRREGVFKTPLCFAIFSPRFIEDNLVEKYVAPRILSFDACAFQFHTPYYLILFDYPHAQILLHKSASLERR